MSRGMRVMVDPAFPDHRKVRALGRALEVHPMQAAGHVLALWCRVMKESPTGDLGSWTDDDIADAAKWEGDPVKFVRVLCSKETRILDGSGAKRRKKVHDWIEEQGDVVAKREKWRKEKAEKREREGGETSNLDGKKSAKTTASVRADSKRNPNGVRAESTPSYPIPSSPIPSRPKRGEEGQPPAPGVSLDTLGEPDESPPSGDAGEGMGETPPPFDEPPFDPPEEEVGPESTARDRAEPPSTPKAVAEAYLATNPGMMALSKAVDHVERATARGVSLPTIAAAVRAAPVGRKLWEILDPLGKPGSTPYRASASTPKCQHEKTRVVRIKGDEALIECENEGCNYLGTGKRWSAWVSAGDRKEASA